MTDGSLAAPPEFPDLVRMLRWRAEHHPDRLALIFLEDGETETERVTYAELDRRVRSIAALLQDRGIVGERVLLLYPQGIEFVVTFFACLYAGAIAVTSPPPRSQRALPRIAAIAHDCGPTMALTTPETITIAKGDSGLYPGLESMDWVIADTVDDTTEDRWRAPNLSESDIAFLQYTSGSTATPKGVMVSHGNLTHNLRMIATAQGHTDETPWLTWLPVHHDMGLIGGILEPLSIGTHCTVMPPIRFIQRPIRWLRAISNYRPHTSGAPNFAYELCIHKTTPEERAGLDLSSWQVAFNGAEPVRAQTVKDFARTFAEYGLRAEALYPNYGLAEGTLIVTGGRKWELPVVRAYRDEALDLGVAERVEPTDVGARVLVSSGRSVPEQEVAIVDPETCEELGEQRIGEIWVHGPSVAQGYWGRRSETERDFRARIAETGKGPYLRTGDLGFMDEEEVFVTGRTKDLIIFHDRNIYPHDIEAAAQQSHDLLLGGTGAAFTENGDEEGRVVLVHEVGRKFRKLDLAQVVTGIRAAVWAELEIPLHAVVLVKPSALPKTSSGKIMRHAVRTRYAEDDLGAVWFDTLDSSVEIEGAMPAAVAPGPETDGDASEVLGYVRDKVASALELPAERIDAGRPIYAMGLDSLTAARLAADVEAELGISLQITAFMQERTLDDLAEDIGRRLPGGRLPDLHAGASRPAASPADQDGNGATEVPLTRGQKALWFQQQLMPDNAAYNVVVAILVRGRLDLDRLRSAIDQLSDRHSLLLAPLVNRRGEPHFAAPDGRKMPFESFDLGDRTDTEFEDVLREIAHKPFEMQDAPLSRVSLLARSPTEHVLVLCLHHIVCDGWSVNVLFDELKSLYEEPGAFSSPSPPGSYADFLRRQEATLASETGTTDLDFWRDRLDSAPQELDLSVARQRPPVQTFVGDSLPIELDPKEVAGVHALAVETGATPFVVLQAIFQVLIHRYTGRTDFLVGTIMAGRTGPGFDRTVGYFVNPAVLRAELSAESSFRSLIVDVRKTVRAAIEHQDLPFAVLVEQLNPRRIANRSPLFQVAFGMTQLPFEAMDSLSAARLRQPGAADGTLEFTPFFVPQQEGQFDLNLEFLETPSRVFGSLNFNTDLFDAETIGRMIGYFRTLLDAVLEEPDTTIAALPILTVAERADQKAWNARSDEMPAPGLSDAATLPQLFEAQVAQTPDAIAVESRGRSLTYAELNERANRLAHHLRKLGVSPDDLIGIFVEKSIEMVVGLVAIHKAGGAYVPMDPDYPDGRIDYMLADSGVRVLLTTQSLRHRYVARPQDTVYLDTDVAEIEKMSADNPSTLVGADNLAYVIYTSGSTGNPKGVMIPHRAACNRLIWKREALGISAADRVLQTIPYSFDPSVWEIFTPLIAGARVVIPRPGTQQEPSQFVQEIIDHGITAFSCVPSLLEHLVDERGFGNCKTLRVVVCGGEPLAPALIDRFAARSSGTIHHFYGPTEATIFATHWPCIAQPPGTRVPIGHAVSHAHVHILDENRQPVPIGVPGELHIGGVGLARGYLNRPELTRDAFIDVPDGCDERGRLYRTGDLARFKSDGVIEFLGRTDTQVKLRGYRVELGEIENRLRAFPGLRDSVVVVRGDPAGQQRLVAHIVPRDSDPPSPGEIRAFVAEALPDYMVPSAFVSHDALPVSPSGKIDRNALPDADPAAAERPPMTPPADALEANLVRIWELVLNVKPIGTQDNFFDLGGHSLLAMRILSRIEKQLGVRLLAQTLFESPTIASLAAALRQKGTPGASASVVAIQPGGDRRPLFCAAPGHGDVIRFAALA